MKLSDIEVLKGLNTMTPISFGGGVRTLEHLNLLKGLPIERLVFSSAFLEKNYELISLAKDLFGHQAIQCLLPVAYSGGEVCVFFSSREEYVPLAEVDVQFIDELANEIVLYDVTNEGSYNEFNFSLLESSPFSLEKLIITGGVGIETVKSARRNNLASVLIDNKVLHQEYSISGYKHAILP